MSDSVEQQPYVQELGLEDVFCFEKEQKVNFVYENGETALWTVILGNNNTGKTTLLRCIAGFEAVEQTVEQSVKYTDYLYYPKHFKYWPDETLIANGLYYSIALNRQDRIETGFLNFSSHASAFKTAFFVDGYGTQRKQGKATFAEYTLRDRAESLFLDEVNSIINAEEWFLGTDYNALKGNSQSGQKLEQVKDALINILPDIVDIEVGESEQRRVHFVTKGGDKVLVNQLGSGYQSLVTWVVDLAKRMFDRYPDSENPLAERAVVLVDEIDLHLHPDWQRKIIAFLSEKFPKTQFIVTAHSPLVVQSADKVNLVLLERDPETDKVKITQPKIENFQGWSVEEILTDLMGMGDKIHSDRYLGLLKAFNEGLDEDNYQKSKVAFDELQQILRPGSTKLELLKLQMTGLAHD